MKIDRRAAAVLAGIVVGIPSLVIGTYRTYGDDYRRGILYGAAGFIVIVAASILAVLTYVGPRYRDRDID